MKLSSTHTFPQRMSGFSVLGLLPLLQVDGVSTTDWIAEWVIKVMETLGGPGAGLIIALENLFPPIPSEVILPLAGFTASQGNMSLAEALFWTTLGSVVGALMLYVIGALFGRARVRAIVNRLPLIELSDVDKAEAWFEKHGVKSIFFGRMVPLVRSFISIPAGLERMPIGTFLLFTTLGSLIWNTIFVMAGYVLGENWWLVEQYAGYFSKGVVIIGGLVVLGFLIYRLFSSRTKPSSETSLS
jgi:membrane protein DedA with SNARE-associated domain